MDLAGWRDIALIVIGIIYGLITLVVAVVAGAIWWFGRKGFKALDRVLDQKARPALDRLEQVLLTVRDRTAALPGNQSIGLGLAPKRRRGLPFPLPFRKRRRRFPFLPS